MKEKMKNAISTIDTARLLRRDKSGPRRLCLWWRFCGEKTHQVLVVVEVSQRELEHTPLKPLRSDLCSNQRRRRRQERHNNKQKPMDAVRARVRAWDAHYNVRAGMWGNCKRSCHEPWAQKHVMYALFRALEARFQSTPLFVYVHHSNSDHRGKKQPAPLHDAVCPHAHVQIGVLAVGIPREGSRPKERNADTHGPSFFRTHTKKKLSCFLQKNALAALRYASIKVACVQHLLVPLVRVTRVLPGLRTWKMEGALMSYHSLRVMGSTLR